MNVFLIVNSVGFDPMTCSSEDLGNSHVPMVFGFMNNDEHLKFRVLEISKLGT
jgi:hypothetical protein